VFDLRLSMMENLVGQRIAGRYQVTSVLGAGGMGIVCRARDERLERDVAIKVLAPGVLSDERVRKRFRKEALALSRVNHPNIAAVFDFISEGGNDFIVMELIPGETLEQKLVKGPLPQRDVLAVGKQIAEALTAAHQSGVIHRDLKPANLRFTDDLRIKVLDFGLAEVEMEPNHELTTASFRSGSSVSGTLPYMAPEQLRGEPPDVRSDVYSSGAVLYEMATGTRAFPQSGFVIVDAILNQIPTAPSRLSPQISPGLENAIIKALDKNPGHRFQTASEMLAELERLTSSTVVAMARTPTPAPKRTRLLRLTAVMAILIVVFSLAAMLKTLTKGKPQETTPAQSAISNSYTTDNPQLPAGNTVASDKQAEAGRVMPSTPAANADKHKTSKSTESSGPVPPIPPTLVPRAEINKMVKEAMKAHEQAADTNFARGTPIKDDVKASEGSTLAVMWTIMGGAAKYRAKLGYYPTTLPELVGFMRESRRARGETGSFPADVCGLEPCMSHGYHLSYTRPTPQAYQLQARPIVYPYTGRRSFFADESSVIHATDENRAATATDPGSK
jgi:serine/threonine protein kinase